MRIPRSSTEFNDGDAPTQYPTLGLLGEDWKGTRLSRGVGERGKRDTPLIPWSQLVNGDCGEDGKRQRPDSGTNVLRC
jgi:hypothetical protein